MLLKVMVSAMSLVATAAMAMEPIEIATATITGAPDATPRPPVQVGFQIAFPMPSAQVSSRELGIVAAVSTTARPFPYCGFGVDLGYEYWPASNEFRETFNAHIRRGLWNLLELGGTRWGFSALQCTPHAKLIADLGRHATMWVKIGGGIYYVDAHLSGIYDINGVLHDTGPSKGELIGGYTGGIGVDLGSSSGARPGLDLSFHRLNNRKEFGEHFQGYTAGVHVLFGR